MSQLDLFRKERVLPEEFMKTIKRVERNLEMKKEKEMPMVKIKAMNAALNTLHAIGCVYKVITPLGDELIHDPSNLLNKRKHHVNRDELPYAHGDLKRHYAPYVDNMQVGDVSSIPYSDTLPAVAIQSSMSAYLSKQWGNGSYTTVTNKEKGVLEVLRIA
jgi:hypothetical protein